uniref:Uncharacterized protein n=1 Tax=Amorphochlora amoebiformis TaxID=1561963 RepID=A0A7S0DQC5_9EUKA|mmetsp:Transcript_34379/g.55365  ORF Transcript_34379/g.55365 Transcript_34379/m.55365 type:complete len:358 (+) Transcript_34379:241-1314(+)
MCTATPHTIYSLFHLRHLIKTKMSRNSRDSKSAADLSKVGPSGSVSEFNTTISRDGGRRLGTVKQMTHSRRGSCKQIKSPFQARLTRTSDDKGKIYSLHFTNKANGGNNNSCREAEKKHLSSSPRKRSISIPLDIKESSEENDTMPTLTVPEQRPASSMDNKESPKMISRSRKTSRRESECMNMRPIDTLSPPTNPRRKSSLGNLDAEKMQTTRRYTLTSLSPRSLNMSSNVDQNRTKSISAIPSDAKVRKKGSMISRIVSASKQIVKKTKPRRKEAMKRALNKVSRLGWILIILTILSFPPMIMIIISIISDSGEPYSEKADAFICNYNSESFGRDVVAYAMLVVQQFIQYYSSNL